MSLKKIIKRALAGILILLLLFIATVFVAVIFYKKEIAGLLKEHLETRYGLKSSIGSTDISFFGNWSEANISFKNVKLEPSSFHDSVPLFAAEELFLSFNLRRLLQKEFVVSSVSIRNGQINLIKDSTQTNFKLVKKDSAGSSTSFRFDVKRLAFENVKFRFINRPRKKTIALQLKKVFVEPVYYSNGLKASLKGDVISDELTFKPSAGSFLKNTAIAFDLRFIYFKETNSIWVQPGSLALINDHRYDVDAFAQMTQPNARLILHVRSKDIPFADGLKLMTQKVQNSLSQFSVNGPLDADALIVAALGKSEDPQLMIRLESRNNSLTVGDSKIPYSNLDIHGKVICVAAPGQAPDLAKAKIIFDTITGRVYNFPFKAHITVSNFKQPYLDVKGHLDIDAAKIKFKAKQKFVLSGHCYPFVSYEGPTDHVRKESFLDAPMKLNATVRFDRVGFKMNAKAPAYVISGKANLNNDDLSFSRLDLVTKGGNFLMNGFVNHFTSYACGFSEGFEATLNAKTDLFRLEPLLAIRDTTDTIHKAKKISEKQIEKITKTAFKFAITLDAKRFSFRKLEATAVNAKINYENAIISIPRLKLNTCEGNIEMKASLHEFNYLKADVKVSDADVRELFKECEDFGQKAISGENLQGQLSGTIGLTAILDGNFKPEPGSLTGKAEVKLKNGHLLNYEPLMNMSHFIFRNRDFEDITFTEINETFYLQDNKMQINELELASNVLNMYIEGIYDFKGESSINMRIPWSNLKRRGKNYVPKSLGEEGKDAKGLKLNYHGPPNKMKLRLGNH